MGNDGSDTLCSLFPPRPRKRMRLLPENAILTYMPPELIEHGEVCGPPHTPPGVCQQSEAPSLRELARQRLILISD